jgi:putative endonuclease
LTLGVGVARIVSVGEIRIYQTRRPFLFRGSSQSEYLFGRNGFIFMRRKELGNLGESLAAQRLEAQGYRIRDRNWRTSEGEVDIIAEERETIVFVEVKTRRSRRFGLPEEAMTKKKRQSLIKSALAYLDANQIQETNWRIDFVAIECSSEGEMIRFEHLVDVVEAGPGEFI